MPMSSNTSVPKTKKTGLTSCPQRLRRNRELLVLFWNGAPDKRDCNKPENGAVRWPEINR
jgi:hypothetical protein